MLRTLPPSGRETAFVVFAQRTDARVDIDAWNAQATRFFATRLGLTEDRRYDGGAPPMTDALRFVVAPDGTEPGIRAALARPCDPGDLALADAADVRAGRTGLDLVARRCAMVWLVERQGPRDALALRLAAIVASIVLGPILDTSTPDAHELFGVKTARAKLERLEP